MYRVCLNKNTGALIEMQSGGDDIPELMDARLDTLRQNAFSLGYKEEEFEVKWVTDEEWKVIWDAQPQLLPPPDPLVDLVSLLLTKSLIKQEELPQSILSSMEKVKL